MHRIQNTKRFQTQNQVAFVDVSTDESHEFFDFAKNLDSIEKAGSNSMEFHFEIYFLNHE